MAQSKFDVIVSLVDKFTDKLTTISGGLNGVKNKLEKMGPAFQKMTAIGAVGLAAVASASNKAEKAFQEQERAEARLQQIATQVTGATKEQIESYKVLASQLQSIGVIGDEVLIAGQSQIASFTKNSEVVTELSDDLADLAVAQYGVNANQDQLIQTGNLLGKALQGQLGALTRTGILVNGDFKKAFEAANTEQERAVILSKIIQDNYGGLNSALRKTDEGMDKARMNTIGDIWESIGKAMGPVLDIIDEKILGLMTRIGEWVSKNEKLLPVLVAVSAGVLGLLTVVGTLGLVLPTIISGFVLLGKAFRFINANPTILLFTALVIAGVALYQNWEVISAKAIEIWSAISAFFTEILNGLTVFFSTVWEGINTKTVEIWEGIKNYFSKIWEGISNVFIFALSLIAGSVIVIFETLGIDIKQVWDNLKTYFSQLWDEISAIFITTIEIISTTVSAFLLNINTLWITIWSGIMLFFITTWEGIKSNVSLGLSSILNLISESTKPITDAFSNMWAGVSGIFTGAWEGIKDVVKSGVNWIINQVNKVIEALNSIASVGSFIPGVSVPKIQKVKNINDAIISPKGDIITTHPDDYLIATKTPNKLLGGKGNGGGPNINITINTNGYVDKRGFEKMVNDVLMVKLRKNLMPS